MVNCNATGCSLSSLSLRSGYYADIIFREFIKSDIIPLTPLVYLTLPLVGKEAMWAGVSRCVCTVREDVEGHVPLLQTGHSEPVYKDHSRANNGLFSKH